MNARGEQLTGFENFKADLVGLMSKNKKLNESNELNKYINNPQNPEYILTKWGVGYYFKP
jgi:DNA-binding response OmpR family regulator